MSKKKSSAKVVQSPIEAAVKAIAKAVTEVAAETGAVVVVKPSVIAITEWIPVPPDPDFPGEFERCWVPVPPGAWQFICVRASGHQFVQGEFHSPSVVGATRPVAPVGQRVEYVLVQIL